MIYSDFKGMKLSRLGFGAMRLPLAPGEDGRVDEALVEKMTRYAIEHGVGTPIIWPQNIRAIRSVRPTTPRRFLRSS